MNMWRNGVVAVGLIGLSTAAGVALGARSGGGMDWFALEMSQPIDLQPADGVDPELRWLSREGLVEANPLDLTGAADIKPWVGGDTLVGAVSGRATALSDVGIIAAQVDGLQSGEYGFARSSRLQEFLVSPYTTVTFQGNAGVSVDASGLDPSGPRWSLSATASIAVYAADAPSVILDAMTFNAFDHQFGTQWEQVGVLSVVFENTTGEWVRGYLSGFVEAEGIAPVPEPATYVLMLLGLGAVWGVSRRVTRRQPYFARSFC